METPRERFIRLLRSTEREGIDKLIDWLDGPDSDWFTAPASSHYHDAYPGGLVDHCLAVHDEMERLAEAYMDTITTQPKSRIIIALLHDLCKINTYKPVVKSRKNEQGYWEKYDGYEHAEQYKFGGHGSKSVFLASRFIQLTDAEAAAINCHMATWEDGRTRETSNVFNEYPEAWMIHAADEAATFIRKK